MSKIETVSGNFVDPLNPDPKTINIKDIAWSSSRMPRFCGHTITEIQYVVGQHAVFVAEMIFNQTKDHLLALYGLLHDSAETYTGDLPSPFKHLPGIKELMDDVENKLLTKIFESINIESPSEEAWKIVKHYDKKAQVIESFAFMPSRGLHWEGREKFDIGFIELQEFPKPKKAIEVYKEFLERFNYHYEELKK